MVWHWYCFHGKPSNKEKIIQNNTFFHGRGEDLYLVFYNFYKICGSGVGVSQNTSPSSKVCIYGEFLSYILFLQWFSIPLKICVSLLNYLQTSNITIASIRWLGLWSMGPTMGPDTWGMVGTQMNGLRLRNKSPR